MSEHFDALETRSPDARAAETLAALKAQIAHAKSQSEAYGTLLADVEPESLNDLTDLARLPVIRKSALYERQREQPPFGGLNAIPAGEAGRIFVSPGPLYELEGRDSDYGRMARALFAAGFRPGDVIHNCFAYHLTPGGWILDAGARKLGCAVVPAGVGQSEQQAGAIAHIRPQGYVGTPDFLKVILDKAAELKFDCGSITRALVSGGALFPSLRAEYRERGVSVLQCYATGELGLIAYESMADDGLIVDEGVIVEIVRPGTGELVPEGEVGEVLVTNLQAAYPLIRFATGDLSAVKPGASACGRTNLRIAGWMGRADQTTKVKGMFVHPEQVAAVVARHAAIGKARLVVTRVGESDEMTLHCEVSERPEGLADAIAETLQSVCKLRGKVALDETGALPNDGKVIEDARSYD